MIFISASYAKKLWTNHERASAQGRAFREHREYILPARFDDTTIPGLRETIGYVDLHHKTPETFARLILKKLGVSEDREKLSIAKSSPEVTVLVVDDDYGVISPVFVPLARDGYRILAAQSVSDALDIIYSDQEITLAICDLILPYGTEVVGHPHYSGIEVIEALRRVRPDVKVLCFSVVSRSEVLARLKSLGVHDTIQKPVRPTELRSRVLAAMESPSEPEQRELVEEEIGRCLAALVLLC